MYAIVTLIKGGNPETDMSIRTTIYKLKRNAERVAEKLRACGLYETVKVISLN